MVALIRPERRREQEGCTVLDHIAETWWIASLWLKAAASVEKGNRVKEREKAYRGNR
jgi:hypothetical protein